MSGFKNFMLRQTKWKAEMNSVVTNTSIVGIKVEKNYKSYDTETYVAT